MNTCKTCGTTDIHSNTTYHFLGTTTEDTTEKFSTNCSTNYEVQFSSFKGHKLKSTEYDDCVYVRCGWKCMCVSATVNNTYNQTLFAHLCGPVYCAMLNAVYFLLCVISPTFIPESHEVQLSGHRGCSHHSKKGQKVMEPNLLSMCWTYHSQKKTAGLVSAV